MPPIAKWIGGIILIPLVVLFMYMAATTGEWIHYTLVTLMTLLVLGGVVMFMYMQIDLNDRGIHLKIRPVIRLQRSFLWEDIAEVTPKKGSALYGWGIRFMGDGWGYLFGGKQMLQVRLRNGKTRYFTTDHGIEIVDAFRRWQAK